MHLQFDEVDLLTVEYYTVPLAAFLEDSAIALFAGAFVVAASWGLQPGFAAEGYQIRNGQLAAHYDSHL